MKLEAICEAAGRTRGSFYHHFGNHGAYLTALAEQWFQTQTMEVADAVDASLPAAEQGAALTTAAISIDYRLELGIRDLGRKMPEIGRIVRKADHARLRMISQIYRERYGLESSEAELFAYLEYATFSGIILLDPDMSRGRQRTLASLYDATIQKALR